MPQYAMRSPRQIRRIGASGISDNHPAKSLENAEQMLFFFVECLRVKFRRFRLERDQRCHILKYSGSAPDGPPPMGHLGALTSVKPDSGSITPETLPRNAG